MRIAFYFGTTFDWNGADLETGLGGAETALVHLSRTFARTGCDVTVYNRTSHPGADQGVTYAHVDQFRPGDPRDVLIALSQVPGLAEAAARVKIHLSMADSESWVGSYRETLPLIHAIFTLSPHHTRILTRQFGVDPGRIVTTRLGIEAADYAEMPPKVPGQLLYCSVPDCGLGYLAPAFRLVRNRVPEATLLVTGDFTLWGHADPGVAPYLPALREIPGVTFLGRIPRSELIRHQKSSVLHVYPCVCNELFCLSSIECQAAATPTVAFATGALPTTVADGQSGLLVKYAPEDPRAIPCLASYLCALLGDRPRLERLAAQARRRALAAYTYDRIVAEWLRLFHRWLEGEGDIPALEHID